MSLNKQVIITSERTQTGGLFVWITKYMDNLQGLALEKIERILQNSLSYPVCRLHFKIDDFYFQNWIDQIWIFSRRISLFWISHPIDIIHQHMLFRKWTNLKMKMNTKRVRILMNPNLDDWIYWIIKSTQQYNEFYKIYAQNFTMFLLKSIGYISKQIFIKYS